MIYNEEGPPQRNINHVICRRCWINQFTPWDLKPPWRRKYLSSGAGCGSASCSFQLIASPGCRGVHYLQYRQGKGWPLPEMRMPEEQGLSVSQGGNMAFDTSPIDANSPFW